MRHDLSMSLGGLDLGQLKPNNVSIITSPKRSCSPNTGSLNYPTFDPYRVIKLSIVVNTTKTARDIF